MSISVASQNFTFQCRKCGRTRKGSFTLFWAVSKKEAAKKMGFKNTRWGAQCLPDCEHYAEKDGGDS